MLLLIHATVGIIAGQAVKKPVWAFLIGIIGHFIVDMIPHGDSRVYFNYKNGEMRKRAMAMVTIDSMATILWVLYMFDNIHSVARHGITAGIAGSVLPDLIVALSEGFSKNVWLQKFQQFHINVHNLIVTKIKTDWPWLLGFAFQIAVLTILVGFIKY